MSCNAWIFLLSEPKYMFHIPKKTLLILILDIKQSKKSKKRPAILSKSAQMLKCQKTRLKIRAFTCDSRRFYLEWTYFTLFKEALFIRFSCKSGYIYVFSGPFNKVILTSFTMEAWRTWSCYFGDLIRYIACFNNYILFNNSSMFSMSPW